MRLDLELFLQATGLIVSIWVFQRLLNIYVHVVASILPICPLSPSAHQCRGVTHPAHGAQRSRAVPPDQC